MIAPEAARDSTPLTASDVKQGILHRVWGAIVVRLLSCHLARLLPPTQRRATIATRLGKNDVGNTTPQIENFFSSDDAFASLFSVCGRIISEKYRQSVNLSLSRTVGDGTTWEPWLHYDSVPGSRTNEEGKRKARQS
jgi:hypothetical protein